MKNGVAAAAFIGSKSGRDPKTMTLVLRSRKSDDRGVNAERPALCPGPDPGAMRIWTMCVICLEFQRSKDLSDAKRMLAAARREPTSIPSDHLDQVERDLAKAGTQQKAPAP